ncbi:hypothetical protein FN846DRAFT_544355 [Sphaerosporella brunnea]|uniref:Uncharacterized protein n=1 Tax=Sphaerosporella brunnea TaxID=1250544 RepID=A0A5J5F2H0_9PEZI|nr:hypothetical protein FN846DRAFT_544355 [Sphaerosporella brunnea]
MHRVGSEQASTNSLLQICAHALSRLFCVRCSFGSKKWYACRVTFEQWCIASIPGMVTGRRLFRMILVTHLPSQSFERLSKGASCANPGDQLFVREPRTGGKFIQDIIQLLHGHGSSRRRWGSLHDLENSGTQISIHPRLHPSIPRDHLLYGFVNMGLGLVPTLSVGRLRVELRSLNLLEQVVSAGTLAASRNGKTRRRSGEGVWGRGVHGLGSGVASRDRGLAKRNAWSERDGNVELRSDQSQREERERGWGLLTTSTSTPGHKLGVHAFHHTTSPYLLHASSFNRGESGRECPLR